MNGNENQNIWSDYLSNPKWGWDYFATITFRQPRRDSLFNAATIWRVLCSGAQTRRAFLISEPHTTGMLHYHGLLRTKRNWLSDGFQNAGDYKLLCEHSFGNSRVEPIRSMAEVSGYISKYVTKAIDSPLVDYYLLGDWVGDLQPVV